MRPESLNSRNPHEDRHCGPVTSYKLVLQNTFNWKSNVFQNMRFFYQFLMSLHGGDLLLLLIQWSRWWFRFHYIINSWWSYSHQISTSVTYHCKVLSIISNIFQDIVNGVPDYIPEHVMFMNKWYPVFWPCREHRLTEKSFTLNILNFCQQMTTVKISYPLVNVREHWALSTEAV